MLVLSRKQSQRIRLGDSIVITVVRVAGDKVRLGIEAPRDMLVLRDELEPHEIAAGAAAVAPRRWRSRRERRWLPPSVGGASSERREKSTKKGRPSIWGGLFC